jgi:hypothetical protein
MCNYGRNGCGRKEKPGATADGAQETEPAREGLPRLPAAVRLAQEMDAGLGQCNLLFGALPSQREIAFADGHF